MKPKPRNHKNRTVRGCLMAALVVAGTTFGGTPAFAQNSADIEALRAEIKASREAYEARIAELEKRLATLEKSPSPPPAAAAPAAAVPATPAAADNNNNLAQRVAVLEQSQQTTSQSLEEVRSPGFFEKLIPGDLTRNLELHAYLRSGYGINQRGGGQEKITSPDGLYQIGPGRLGDEPDTYGELTFKYNMPRADENAVKFGFQTTLAFKYNGDKNNYTSQNGDGVDLLFREAFVTASNVFRANPDVQFWAGQRFYDRHDIHIYDYYFLDTSGYGGGVENIKLGPGKLAVAWIGGTDNTAQVKDQYSLTKQIIDIRWSDLPSLFGGKGTLWVSPQYVNGGSGIKYSAGAPAASQGIPDDNVGLALGWIQFNDLGKGYNKLSLQYGFGAGYQFGAYVPLTDTANGQPGDFLKDAWSAQITNQLVWQFSDQFSLMWAAVANWEDKGWKSANESGSDRLFLTTAVRPIYMLTEHLGIETELGIDWANDVRWTLKDDDQSALAKLTVAAVIKPSGAFWSRPEIRAYASYYYWGGGMPGWYVPNGEKNGSTGSWTFGIQAETWW